MNAEDLIDWIDSLTADIEFEYQGILGAICPYSRTDISFCYGDDDIKCSSIDEVMTTPFITGRPLKDICEEITFG